MAALGHCGRFIAESHEAQAFIERGVDALHVFRLVFQIGFHPLLAEHGESPVVFGYQLGVFVSHNGLTSHWSERLPPFAFGFDSGVCGGGSRRSVPAFCGFAHSSMNRHSMIRRATWPLGSVMRVSAIVSVFLYPALSVIQ